MRPRREIACIAGLSLALVLVGLPGAWQKVGSWNRFSARFWWHEAMGDFSADESVLATGQRSEVCLSRIESIRHKSPPTGRSVIVNSDWEVTWMVQSYLLPDKTHICVWIEDGRVSKLASHEKGRGFHGAAYRKQEDLLLKVESIDLANHSPSRWNDLGYRWDSLMRRFPPMMVARTISAATLTLLLMLCAAPTNRISGPMLRGWRKLRVDHAKSRREALRRRLAKIAGRELT